MDTARPNKSKKLLTIDQAAQKLGVSVEVLLDWNEQNILKPTITKSGTIGYQEDQIERFASINHSLTPTTTLPPTDPTPTSIQPLPQKISLQKKNT